MDRRRIALGFLAFTLPAVDGAAFTLVEDEVGGSCRKMIAYQSGSGVALDGKHYPGKWGITVPKLFIGDKAVDDPDVLDEIGATFSPPTRRASSVCVETSEIRAAFRAESRVGVIEWEHGRKEDSRCAKEWDRVRNIIRTHEPHHVKDVEDIVADANARVAAHAPIGACAASEAAARQQVARRIVAMLRAEAASIRAKAEAKAKALDVETATMNCKLCEGGLEFKDVTIDCTIPTPKCTVTTGQVIAGRVCGDPTSSPWTITPHYFAKGCNIPPIGTKGDKAFTNDCVAEGSAEEKRRADVFRRFHGAGAGGWMCVYRDGPNPQIVIRNFRMSVCKGPAEQTIVADAQPADCD